MKSKIKDTLLSFVITGVQVFIIVFLIEWIYRGSFGAALQWISWSTRPFVYNFLLLFLLFGSLHIFKRKLWILFSFILTVLLLILAIACNVKQALRGEPVLPSDLFLGAEATNMANIFSSSLLVGLAFGAVLLLLLLGIAIYKVPNQKERNWIKITLSSILLLSFLIVFSIEKEEEGTTLKNIAKIKNNVWIQSETYQKNGVVASFVMNMQWLTIDVPENYSKDAIHGIVETQDAIQASDTEKPDIIVVMSEAFWDPMVLNNIEFNKDPIPYFRKLQQEHTSGDILVPVFGGSTANTEFEVLTGISTHFLPVASIPYLHYLNKPIPSLPFALKEQGYDTTAIHTFNHWFYNRSTVYQNLGFDRYISMEFLENPIPVGPYFHDATITDEILKKLDMNPDKPDFIFAVTTQNHGPYSETDKLYYASNEIVNQAETGLTDPSVNMLEFFSDSLSEADKEFERLIKEVEKRDKKTMVVFFGDHLPLLGYNYDVYRQNGFYKDDKSYEEYLRMYTTPLVIWDNFSDKKQEVNIGTMMLAPVILDRAGLEGNYLTDYLLNQYRSGQVSKIVRNDFLAQENIDENTLSELRLLQYDMLFGELYGMKGEKLAVNEDYRLGYGSPEIKDAAIKTQKGEEVLQLKGDFFTGYSDVFINGDKAEKVSVEQTNMIVRIPKKDQELNIVVKILDSGGKVLAESNEFTLKSSQ